jgi:branched-chain amino acid aminotransferase
VPMVDLSNLGLPVRGTLAPAPPQKLPAGPLGFGKILTDHVLLAEHTPESGWSDVSIQPRVDVGVELAAGALQYGLSIFEGLKAYRAKDGRLFLFRPDAHARRLAKSAARLCMPPFDEKRLVAAIRALTRVEQEMIPPAERGSLYIRPVIFASDEYLGVRPGNLHTLAILASPVESYFAQDARPLRLWAERELTRAAPGGVGEAKTGGNYAASLLAAQRAKHKGYDQVLWLDALEHRYLEEVGTMNLFIHLKSGVVTPPTEGTILKGVTRDSCMTLLREWGISVQERRITLDELEAASARGELLEVFGTGTAAVVAPVGEVAWEGGKSVRPSGGPVAQRLKDALSALHRGEAKDSHGWLQPV